MSDPFKGPPILNPHEAPTREEFTRTLSQADQEEYSRVQHMASLVDPGGVRQLQVVMDILIIIGGWMSVSLELFTRKEFGERYFTPLRFGLGLVVLGAYFALVNFGNFFSAVAGQASLGPVLLFFYIFAYIIAGLLHRFDIFYRNNYSDQLWYSRSFGVTRLKFLLGYRFGPLPPLDDWFIFLYVEPIGCFVIGWLLYVLSMLSGWPTGEVGVWVIFASLMLQFKNQALYGRERDEFLNMNDARIKSLYLMAAARGAPKEQTGGYTVVSLPYGLDRNRDGVPDFLQDAALLETPMGAQAAPPSSSSASSQSDLLKSARATAFRQTQPEEPGGGQPGARANDNDEVR